MDSVSQSRHGATLRERLEAARLYLVCDSRPGGRELGSVLEAAISGGVQIVQLRDKALGERQLRRAAERALEVCRREGALFIVNDHPELARAVGADGVHLGQHDMPLAQARALLGPDPLIGLSTHGPEEIRAHAGADYLGVGPVHATPTKPGRPAVGLELVADAAAELELPFFAIGGIDTGNVGAVIAAGARRIAVVRAVAEAPEPREAARALSAALERAGAGVGAP